jgi:twinkle protein
MEEYQTSELVEKTACPNCPSSDAYAIYDDGDGKSHGYCFSCRTYVHDLSNDFDDEAKPTITPTNKSTNQSLPHGEYADIPARKLFAKSLKKFGYSVGDGKHYAPYFDKNGVLVAVKVRGANKEFYVVGDMKKATLFGQNLWSGGAKRLVCFEGEVDCVSYGQATNLTWECVSVPSGAAGAAKAIRQNIEFIESHAEVVFCFDNDEAGQEAAIECAALLKPGLAKIAKLPLKDASDMLVAGRVEELKTAIYTAKTYRPDGIVQGDEIDLAEVIKATPKGLDVPYNELNAALRGFRKRELYMLCAGSGVGKSTFAKELGVHLAKEHGQRIGWVMLEESLNKTVQSIVAIDNDVPVGDLMENPLYLEESEWRRSMHQIVENCAFYDAWGSTEVDNLMQRLRYLAVGCECDFIVLDHVSMVISGLDVEERKTLDVLLTKLRQFVEQTGVGVIAISHLRRNNSKTSFNRAGEVDLNDLRGSASLEQLSDVVLSVERNQMDEDRDKAEVSQLRLLKNRPFGQTGPVGFVKYDRHTGRLKHFDQDMPVDVEDFEVPF